MNKPEDELAKIAESDIFIRGWLEAVGLALNSLLYRRKHCTAC